MVKINLNGLSKAKTLIDNRIAELQGKIETNNEILQQLIAENTVMAVENTVMVAEFTEQVEVVNSSIMSMHVDNLDLQLEIDNLSFTLQMMSTDLNGGLSRAYALHALGEYIEISDRSPIISLLSVVENRFGINLIERDVVESSWCPCLFDAMTSIGIWLVGHAAVIDDSNL